MKHLSERRLGGSHAVLHPEEGVRLDPARILSLFSELGEDGAESLVGRAIAELAMRLAEIQRAKTMSDARAISRSAEHLARVAGQIGMTSLARVAVDVRICARSGDGAGLGATMARLARIAEQSFAAAWDLNETMP